MPAIDTPSAVPQAQIAPSASHVLVPLVLETFLPYRLNVIAAQVSQAFARVYSNRFGISIPEWRVLAALGQFGSITARDIGAHGRLHKTTVSRAVADLEKRKLVIRRLNKADMREAFLALTDSGMAIYHEIVPLALGFTHDLCAGLSAEEVAHFNRLLDRMQELSARLADQS